MESPVKGAVFLAGIQIILCTLKGTPRVGSYFFLGYTIYTYDCGEERPASSTLWTIHPDSNSTAVNYKNWWKISLHFWQFNNLWLLICVSSDT